MSKTRLIIMSLTCLLLVVIVLVDVAKSDEVKKSISPNMTMEISKDGAIIFVPDTATEYAMARTAQMQGGRRPNSEMALTSGDMADILETMFDEAKKRVCSFKYKPDTFGLSAAGYISATWRTKDVCK